MVIIVLSLLINCQLIFEKQQLLKNFNPLICMSNLSSSTQDSEQKQTETNISTTEPKPSYVKHAMRNMVRKGGTSIRHFALTSITLIGILIGLSYLTR